MYNHFVVLERIIKMKKTICKKEYNTETSTLIHKYTYGYYGDPHGLDCSESFCEIPFTCRLTISKGIVGYPHYRKGR